MAALVQSYPQQSGTGTMLQTRPMPSPVSGGQQYMAGPSSSQRNSFHGLPGTMAAPAAYRGTSGPIQPYAFTSTPSLNTNTQWQQFPAYRTTSSPAVPTVQNIDKYNVPGRLRHGGSQSVTSLPYNPSMGVGKSGSRDDSSIRQPRTVTTAPRPQSAYMSGTSTQLSLAQAAPVKPSPERYRRAAPPQRSSNSAPPSGSGMTAINHLYNPNEQRRGNEASPARRPGNFNGSAPGTAVDDMQLYRRPTDEETKRLRRRSMPALDSADFPKPQAPLQLDAWSPEKSTGTEQAPKAKFIDKDQKSLRMVSPNAAADSNMQNKNGSSESLVSTRSSNSRPSSSANRNAPLSVGNSSAAPMLMNGEDSAPTQDYPKLINIPPRGSSDVGKRVAAPSPLSQPVTMASDAAADQMSASPREALTSPPLASPSTPVNSNMDSPAAKHLAAINEKGNKGRSKTSRLRRAFSFGSAADFRKAAGADAPAEHADGAEPTRLHKEPTAAELYDVEQARIAKKQEEGGIGNSIYRGKLFSGSTDNISISSTASSASIMIRKMGRGVKRSTRSLVGLFRPKSVIGAPTTDAVALETSQASVSMVTAEAERERVNVHADMHAQVAGGTGFPHLERNSVDTGKAPSMVSERAGSSGTDNSSAARRSIVGSDKDRAEVLAAVRKGILKSTSGSSSPVRSAVDAKGAVTAFDLPSVPSITDSPQSSVPSTPTDEVQGHKRSGSVAIGNEDYFMTALRLRQDTKSAPGTPRGTSKRNATFSPRIVFYDTWPSQEYDRRGEIATCNRLTPMLAQQIKEELNNFKMEMEVHENSKIYTHFF